MSSSTQLLKKPHIQQLVCLQGQLYFQIKQLQCLDWPAVAILLPNFSPLQMIPTSCWLNINYITAFALYISITHNLYIKEINRCLFLQHKHNFQLYAKFLVMF